MTQRIKLVVSLVFVLFASIIYLAQPFAPHSRGAVAGSSLPEPTGVSASDGDYGTKVGLRWDTMRGATNYRVYRNTTNTPGSATDIGTTPANYFFDMAAVAGQTYFYWVRAENGVTSSSFSVADQGSRAVATIPPGPFPALEPPQAPDANPVTAAKASLGKTLFWDEQMSSTRTVACGTCHRPAEGGSDPRTSAADPTTRNPGPDNTFGTLDDIFGSPGVIQNNADGTYGVNALFGYGVQVTGRKSPTYLNAAYVVDGTFWDGRAANTFRDPLTNQVLLPGFAAVESQAAGPPVSSAEMAHMNRNWTEVAARIQTARPLALASNIPVSLKTWIGGRTYPQLFEEAFGSSDVTPARIAMAIGTHERTLFSDHTPFDRELEGVQSLTMQERNGRDVFNAQGCAECHDRALLSNHRFENIGVRPVADDPGRGAVTGLPGDNGRFKTPNLRNIELRAPYMHNGATATLEDVVEFYNRGGDFDAPNIDRNLIRPLNLMPQERADLVAFMKRPLTDDRVKNELPPFDRPKLYTETTRVPALSGTGRAGTGAITPDAIAISPPLLGNPNFTVGVKGGLGGAQAYLSIGLEDPGTAAIPGSGIFAYRNVTLSGSGAGNGYGSVNVAIPDLETLIGRTYYGRWYVVDAAAANGFSVSRLITFKVFSPDSSQLKVTHADFDGDGKTDVSTYRDSTQAWYVNNSGGATPTLVGFGYPTDIKVPADYDGDGRVDMAEFRDGYWFSLQSTNGFTVYPFGSPGDIPQPGDYDGDGKADYGVFRPSTGVWYVMRSTAGFTALQFGQNGDKPVASDYDGDGKVDYAVYRDGAWYLYQTTAGFMGIGFGLATDKPVIGDYDGDGKTDAAVWRPSDGTWYWLRANFSLGVAQFGIPTDIPAPGDYDGDGTADPAVFRDGAWYMLGSTSGFFARNWGLAGDRPLPATIVPQ